MTRARHSLPKAATEASPHVVLHTHLPGPSQKTSRSEQSALFSAGEKCETPHETPPQQLLEEAMRDQDLGGAGHHAELECQRSALRLLLNSDLGENLENLHRYQMRNCNVGGLLDRQLDYLNKRHDRGRFHRFHRLRCT